MMITPSKYYSYPCLKNNFSVDTHYLTAISAAHLFLLDILREDLANSSQSQYAPTPLELHPPRLLDNDADPM